MVGKFLTPTHYSLACLRAGGINAVDGEVTISSSTIVSNRVDILSGGSTLCSNPSSDGAGVRDAGADTVALINSIVAENTHDGSASDCAGDVVSGGFNLIGTDDGCNFAAAFTDVVGNGGGPIDPLLGSLTSAGSPTSYHLPSADSPATDEGAACGSLDQRGRPRPADGNDSGGAQCDIGAVERQ